GSRQNRGRSRSRGRPSTLLPGCDGFATPVRSPESRLGFYLFTLNGRLSQCSMAPERARARCAAAFARLPHTAMLHQRRPWALLTSKNHSVQVGPSHLRTSVKSFSQTRSPIASAIGNSSVLGLSQ